ncbi:carbohydrate kinase family protein [Paenibacillus nasutitermitis]|uniref:Carbohydrate kinase n=1 Tax=Paenibacillus nasutitermitis TaxID=1652958 RepID=A0A916YJM0_9BACL|nr:carbohydrate kinase family protein [Paenibacillus nasutitermitis]GGD47768.1 carbohydrate kinase [Paenibacillus nasutitermitis]
MVKKFDAVVIGDANIDLVVAGCNEIPKPGQEIFVDQMMLHVGGGAALFSISLAKLGMKVAFNGILGDDGHGRYVREQFVQYGIDTSMLETTTVFATGITIAINPEVDRSFITYAGSNQLLDVSKLDLEPIARGKHVHLTCYKGRSNHGAVLALAKALKEKGLTLSCDVGWDDTGEWYEGIYDLMREVDVFLMNETEAMHYTGLEKVEDCLQHIAQYGSHIVIKLGDKGAVALKDGVRTYSPAYQVQAVDTTGAGDSFNAGYLYGYLNGMETIDCLISGNACGALSVGSYGGSGGTPDRDGLKAFIRQKGKQSEIQEVSP